MAELTPENELIIRRALAGVVEGISEAGYVIPSARYCSGIEDFWASADVTEKATQEDVETSLIGATWIYPLQFSDDFSSGGIDSPLIRLTYELYIFRQYGLMREDETETPDVFDKKVLVQHNDFVAAWLGIKGAFQREANIAGLPDGIFATARTTPVIQPEAIANQVICEFVPGVVGFAVRLHQSLKIKLAEC